MGEERSSLSFLLDPLDKHELLKRFLVTYGEFTALEWILEITEFCAGDSCVNILSLGNTEVVVSFSRDFSCKS